MKQLMTIGAPPAAPILRVNLEPSHLFKQENVANNRPADIYVTFEKPIDTPGGPASSGLAMDISIVADPLSYPSIILGDNGKVEGFAHPHCVTHGDLKKVYESYNNKIPTGVANKLREQNIGYCPIIVSSLGAMGPYLHHLLMGTSKHTKQSLMESCPSLWLSNSGVVEPIHFPLNFNGHLPAASQHQRFKGEESDEPKKWWALNATKQLMMKLSNAIVSSFYNFHTLMSLPVNGRIPCEKDAKIYHLKRGDFPTNINPHEISSHVEEIVNSDDDLSSEADKASNLVTPSGHVDSDLIIPPLVAETNILQVPSFNLDDDDRSLSSCPVPSCECSELRHNFFLKQHQLRTNEMDSSLNPPLILSLSNDINDHGTKLRDGTSRERFHGETFREIFVTQYQKKFIKCQFCRSSDRLFWKFDDG